MYAVGIKSPSPKLNRVELYAFQSVPSGIRTTMPAHIAELPTFERDEIDHKYITDYYNADDTEDFIAPSEEVELQPTQPEPEKRYFFFLGGLLSSDKKKAAKKPAQEV